VAANQIVVMGVAGSGKSSIGTLIAKELGLPFKDGDDLHPQSNLEKMAAGIPLTDEDRWPWLELCGLTLQMPNGTVLACSALKRVYRDRIRKLAPGTTFLFLDGSEELLLSRLGNRKNHFMKPQMLQSQLQALEPLQSDEKGLKLRIDRSEEEIVQEAIAYLGCLAPTS
jgi:carbohydrate kinase (thermoresistant glucokinase family)